MNLVNLVYFSIIKQFKLILVKVKNMYYLNCFFIYSFIGFILENIVYFIIGHGSNSGFLYGPITPIYGICSILIIIISNFLFKKLHLKRWVETVFVFVVLTIIITVLEFIGGNLLEHFLNMRLWDYRNMMFNIGRYIALEISIVWGLLAIILIYIVKPLMDKLIKKIPNYITIICLIIFVIDLTVTLINRL